VRTPIESRIDGRVCKEAGGLSLSWLGILDQGSTHLVQIGFDHIWDPTLGIGKHCRFWANDEGSPLVQSGCGSQVNDQFVWFKIEKLYDDGRRGDYYYIYDCGTDGGYDTCLLRNSTQPDFGSSTGIVALESKHGDNQCAVQIMGSLGDPQDFGKTGYPIAGKHNLGDPWEAKPLTPGVAMCIHYDNNFGIHTMDTWDDRNDS
jgi:hypothetical protein